MQGTVGGIGNHGGPSLSLALPLPRLPDLTVQLDVWLLDAYQGHPKALENQPLQWIAPENLIQIPILAADLPIIEALLDHC